MRRGFSTGNRTPDSSGSPVGVANNRRYQVNDLVIDPGRARVSRGGVEISLPKLSYDLLVALVEAAPNLASIDDLMERVWPGLVVSPETVSQRVKLLRTALGDDSRQPRYVLGVRGRGYRLLADVQRDSPVDEPTPAMVPGGSSATIKARGDRRQFRWMIFAAAVALLVAIGTGIALRRSPTDTPAPPLASDVRAAELPARSVAVLPFENLGPELDDDLLALGIAEAVLHQLANLHDLSVIARTSSFAAGVGSEDARAIGRRLNARYLLEGSVQSDRSRLRVTAQLIDSQTGSHVWSIRFDRTPQDIFAVQDEIATQVARALASSVADAGTPDAWGAEKLDAWLPYVQGRALLTTRRLPDLEQAKARFAEAIRVDPSFASAYVGLAEAKILSARFPRTEWWGFGPPIAEQAGIEELIARALALDPTNGDAYLLRAFLGWVDHPVADFRRGLALSPNNALGYERFARVLFESRLPQGRFDPAKRAEAFVMIDRARAINPLAPSGHLTKGVMMLQGRSDTKAANALMLQALELDPNYYLALMHLAELNWCCQGEFAEAVRFGERTLALEPKSDLSWLVNFYLDIGEPEAARRVLESSDVRHPSARLPLLLYDRAWTDAGELAFSSRNAISGGGRFPRILTLRAATQYARATGDTARARKFLEQYAMVDWSASGEPIIRDITTDMTASVELAALMLANGEASRGRVLLRAVLRQIELEAQTRGDMWFGSTRPQALALLGETDAAIEALRNSVDSGFMPAWWYRLEREHAYDRIRSDPRFVAILEDVKRRVAAQQLRLDAMRAADTVPIRAPQSERASTVP